MRSRYPSDTELLSAIRAREEAAIQYAYQTHWPMVLQLVKVNSGNPDDAKDLYQEAFMDFLERVWDERFVLTCKIKTFIYTVCRNKWWYHLRGKPHFTDIEVYIQLDDWPVDSLEAEADLPDDQQIIDAIVSFGEPCKSLLLGFYFEKLAEKCLYKTPKVAKQQKFRCLERLKRLLS